MTAPRMSQRLINLIPVVLELQQRGYRVEQIELAASLPRPVILVEPTPGCRALDGQRTAERVGHVVHHLFEARIGDCRVQWAAP